MEPKHFESLFPPESRFEELEKTLSFLKSGNSAQIISLPGVGRSNILGILAFNKKARTLHLGENEKIFHFVMMNFSEIKGKPLSEATKYMFLELVDSLEARNKTEEYEYAQKIFDQSIKTNDQLLIFQGLRKIIDYLCLEKQLNVVFLFDRFEDYTPMINADFFNNLRVLRDRAKYRFSCIFTLNRPLEETLEQDIISNYYEFVVGNIVYLPLMDKKLLDFRISYIEKAANKTIPKEILDQIIKSTGGIGKLVRISTELYFSEENNDLNNLLASNSRINAVLSEVWNSFTPFEQSLIKTNNAKDSSHLVAIGLVKDGKISVPLIEEYAKKYSTGEKISLDESKKNIKRGESSISESLTASEFKLLKFMIENKDKILERDEVIQAVWGDLNSTTGVTEQALDQLVFRVRKKIEDNPNSPTHLLTIKGRGFKFVQ